MIPLVSKNSGTLNAEMMSKNINAEHESSSDDTNNTPTKPNNVDTELKENKSSDDEQTNIVNNANPITVFKELDDEKNNIFTELNENEAPMMVLVCEHNKFGHYSIKDKPACSCDGYTSVKINDMLSRYTIEYKNDNSCYFEVTITQDLTNIGGVHIGYQLIDKEREEFKKKDYYDSDKQKWRSFMVDYGKHHVCVNAFQLDADESNDNDKYWKKGDIIGCAMIIESDGCVIIYYRNGKVFDTISPYIKPGSINNYALSDEVSFDVCFKKKDLRYNNEYSELKCRGSGRVYPVTLTNDLFNLAAIYLLKRNTTKNEHFILIPALLWFGTLTIAVVQGFAYFALVSSFATEWDIEEYVQKNFDEITFNRPLLPEFEKYTNDSIISLESDDTYTERRNNEDTVFIIAGCLILFIYIGSSIFNTAAERFAIIYCMWSATVSKGLKAFAVVAGYAAFACESVVPMFVGIYILIDIEWKEERNKSDLILAPVGIIFINEFDNLIAYVIAKWVLNDSKPDFWIMNEMILFPEQRRIPVFMFLWVFLFVAYFMALYIYHNLEI